MKLNFLIEKANDEIPVSKGQLTNEFLEDHTYKPRDDYLILVCC